MLRTGLDWQGLFARTGRTLRGSDIRDLLRVTARPSIISFGGGLPAPELFPLDELRAAFDRVLVEEGRQALQYGPTEGHRPLREFLAERLGRRGIACTAEEVLITTGSQQALDLLGRALLAPHMEVLVESPTYVGALQALGHQQVSFLPVRMDEEGLVVDELARSLDGRRLLGAPPPGLLYTVATFQNPSGRTLTRERRLALLDVVNAFGLPLVEDDPYSELRFEGDAVPALKGLQGGDDVVYLGTFSKILSPGMRLGWVAGPRPLIDQLVLAKQASDLHTDSVAQRAALRFCLDNDIDAHVERLCGAYAERRDAMLAALTDLMPEGTTWTHPEGGMFLWLTLPPGLDSRELLDEALRLRVAFVPGDAFHVDGGGASCVRLNYTGSAPDRIWEGVARLATATRRLASRR